MTNFNSYISSSRAYIHSLYIIVEASTVETLKTLDKTFKAWNLNLKERLNAHHVPKILQDNITYIVAGSLLIVPVCMVINRVVLSRWGKKPINPAEHPQRSSTENQPLPRGIDPNIDLTRTSVAEQHLSTESTTESSNSQEATPASSRSTANQEEAKPERGNVPSLNPAITNLLVKNGAVSFRTTHKQSKKNAVATRLKSLLSKPVKKLRHNSSPMTLEKAFIVIETGIALIKVHGINNQENHGFIEGIFRVSGSKTKSDKLSESVKKSKNLKTETLCEKFEKYQATFYEIAVLMKTAIQELNPPLLSYDNLKELKEIMNGEGNRPELLRNYLDKVLDKKRKKLMDTVLFFLFELCQYEKITQMNLRNYGINLAQCFFSEKVMGTSKIMEVAELAPLVTRFMIENITTVQSQDAEELTV